MSRVANSRAINIGNDCEQENVADGMGDGEGVDVYLNSGAHAAGTHQSNIQQGQRHVTR